MSRADTAQRVVDLLDALKSARDPRREPLNASRRLIALKRWQRLRLAATFADLAAEPRHAAATRFFLDDLYGEHDASWRDRDVARMLPTLRAWLPAGMLVTVADALELDLVSHRLDLAVTHALPQARERRRLLDIARRAQRAAMLQQATRTGLEPLRDREHAAERGLGHG